MFSIYQFEHKFNNMRKERNVYYILLNKKNEKLYEISEQRDAIPSGTKCRKCIWNEEFSVRFLFSFTEVKEQSFFLLIFDQNIKRNIFFPQNFVLNAHMIGFYIAWNMYTIFNGLRTRMLN